MSEKSRARGAPARPRQFAGVKPARPSGIVEAVVRDLPQLRIALLILVPFALMGIGTVGYQVLEGWSAFDALYMTVITLTTVGYGEIPSELSIPGRWFTIALLLGGVFTFFFAAGEMIRIIVTGEVQAVLGRRRMERSLAEMKDHLIVCGYGRMGKLVCREFSVQNVPFVVIDRKLELLQGFDLTHGIPLHGDITSDEVLKRAGIDRARALVTVVGSDSDNLFITLSARLLNESLFIVSRAEDEQTHEKLMRAGADRVVSPYVIGGSRVAQAILRPTVVEFLDLATHSEHFELKIEEILITASSKMAGVTLSGSLLHKNHGIFVVAIKKSSGQMVFNPPGDTVLEGGDTLIALGHRTQLDQIHVVAQGK